jgi:ribonuclease BN (tRNA processing enzyme)
MMTCIIGAASEVDTNNLGSNRNTSQPNKNKTNLILLGTAGGPIIRNYRSQPAALLTVNGKQVLVDCGEGTVRQLQQIGLGPEAISKIFFTHLHFDHTAGLASLLAFDWAGNNSRPVDIYGPPGTDNLVKSAINYFAVPIDIFRPMLKRPDLQQLALTHTFDATEPKVVFKDENMTITAVENSHYKAVKLGAMPYGIPRSYSYRFTTNDRTIFFTGDTGPSEAVTQLASGADILVSEVIDINRAMIDARARGGSEQGVTAVVTHQRQEHLTPQEVGKIAKTANVKMVILTHLAFADDSEGKAADFINGVREIYAGPVVAGRDFDEF